jgi:transposase
MSNFRPIDRQTGFLVPPSVDEWLPEKHLARFVVEGIDGLDLRVMSASDRGSGSASYPPSLLLGILVYGYATGVFSSRKLERATDDSVAFRFIAANQQPDHAPLATFRRRFLEEIEGLFVQVLELAREMGLLRMGPVALDGTKIHANASRHSALCYEHAGRIAAPLKAEVADRADLPDGLSIPEELARREERLTKLAEARARIEARARERFEREQAEHEAKLAARDAKAEASGRKPRGKPPHPPVEGPRPTDPVNLSAEESRIMPVAGGGFAPLPFGSTHATTPRPWWWRAACWWSRPPSSKPPTTSRSSSRGWTSSPPWPRTWARPRPCWPTPAPSAQPMWRLAKRPGSRR